MTMCYTISGSKRKPPTQCTLKMYYTECFHRGAIRWAKGDILAGKRPILPAGSTAQFCVKRKLYIFIAMHSCTNDVTQHKLPYDLTRLIFLGSHCRMCYIPNASSRENVYMYTHLQSVPSAAWTIRDLLWLPSAAHGGGLQPHRRQYRADKRGVRFCVTSQIRQMWSA